MHRKGLQSTSTKPDKMPADSDQKKFGAGALCEGVGSSGSGAGVGVGGTGSCTIFDSTLGNS